MKECRTCAFRREGLAATDPIQCRRFPPTVTAADGIYSRTFWPIVRPNEWCGEWKQEDKS